ATASQRAHGGATAEMRDDHSSVRKHGCDLRQMIGDVFVGEAVKAVAAHAFGVKFLWDREVIGERAMAAVESGVETRHLRQLRPKFKDRADRREIVRLVKRRKRNVTREAIEYFRAHQNGL